MDPRRVLALLGLVPMLLLAGCGGGDDDGGDGSDKDDSRDATSQSVEAQGDPDEPASAETRTGGASAFALTPELTSCMEAAGFEQDAPPTGGLAAWRHASGGRVVVGSGPDVTVGIASEIGTAERPANVEGAIVIAANDAETDAAQACLAADG